MVRSLFLSFLLLPFLVSCTNSKHYSHDLGYIHGFNDGRDQAFIMQVYSRCLEIRDKKDCALLRKKIDKFEKKFEDTEKRLQKEFYRGNDG